MSSSLLHEYWFSATAKANWWRRSDEFDEELRERFGAVSEAAAAGDLWSWLDGGPQSRLALILALDQLPRNLHRNSSKAFAGDGLALWVARRALDRGDDLAVEQEQRLFIYMPFMHSEDLRDQNRCVELLTTHGPNTNLAYAWAHREIIFRFGRFPHRNEVLGRRSTPDELEFLKRPGSGF